MSRLDAPARASAKPRASARRRGQWSLIGLLVSLAVIAILSAWYYGRILKPQAGSHNGRPAAEQEALGTACSVYQSQLTQAVMMYKGDHNDRPPRDFAQLKPYGVTDQMVRAEGCQFQLDPATGTVTDLGHGQAAPNAAPVVLGGGSPAPGGPNPGGPNPGGSGPGGVTLPPNAGGSVPASGGGDGAEGQ